MSPIACYITRFHKARLPFLKAHWEHHKPFCFAGFVGLDADCQDDESKALVESLGLQWVLNQGESFNEFLGTLYNIAKQAYKNEWILSLDSDEYINYENPDTVIRMVQEDKSDWIAGWLCDRFGPGGQLLPCPTESYEAMSLTYPLATNFTRDVMKACETKATFRKTYKNMHDSIGVRSPHMLRLDHFKWTDTIREELEQRIAKLGNVSYAWQHKNALAAIRGDHMHLGDSWMRTQSRIEGWFDYEDLYQMIAKEAPQNSTLVELGVWMGKSASFLMQNLEVYGKNFELWLVDNFKNAPTHYAKYAVDTQMGIPEARTRASYLYRTVANLQRYRQLEKANVLQCNSARAARLFDDQSCYFVYIDADHSYEACKADIKAWLPKVTSPGVIAGHDYDWSTVRKAVDEQFGNSVKTNHNQKAWFVRV